MTRKTSFGLSCALALSIGLSGVTAFAGVSESELISAGMPPGFAGFGAAVSRSEGNWHSENQKGCVGAFQFCEGTFERFYPSGDKAAFKNDPRAQVDAWMRYQKSEWDAAQRFGAQELIGTQICYGGRCSTVTSSSILYACQFGCQGTQGKLALLMADPNMDCDAREVKDGNLVSVCEYLIRGSGYDVSDLTGMEDGDMAVEGSEFGVGTGFPLMRWNDIDA